MMKKTNWIAGLKMVRKTTKYLCLLLVFSCKQAEKKYPGNYPKEAGDIILNECATSGCHNSATASAGLDLSSWESLFKGGNGGAAIIPYRPDFSTFCFYTNTDTNLGVTLSPTMPLNGTPLSKSEYIALFSWIANGAPSASGKIAFAENPERKKIYAANRICDVVTVFDRATFLQMRYIDIGNTTGSEFAENIQVSPDRKNWYVSFFGTTNYIQQFDAANDRYVKNIQPGYGNWHSFAITQDSKHGYFADNNNPGHIIYMNLADNKILARYDYRDKLVYPLGMALNEPLQKLYAGVAMGNFIYSINISNPLEPAIQELPIDGSATIQTNSSLDPTILLTAENNLCYIACQRTHEIRVMNMDTDTLIAVISLPDAPQSLSYSYTTHRLFVACPNDNTSFAGNRGSIIVIDGKNNTIVKKINSGYEPYSISVDDESGIAAVANTNLHNGGPAPHHASKCGGRNGYVTFIDLQTLELATARRSEVAVFPYSISTR